jgi:3,4-dihydroxy 2-butanone 4-phosphate synthase/GTP cyclohydrolase II
MVAVVDPNDRGRGQALIAAARNLDAAVLGAMIDRSAGLVGVAMPASALRRLHLEQLAPQHSPDAPHDFAVPVDYREGRTTGLSAEDRARTVRSLADPRTRHDDLLVPGYVLPVRAREGGCLVRRGFAEAGLDLARLAGCGPFAAITSVPEPNTRSEPEQVAAAAASLVVSMDDIVEYRLRHDALLEVVATARLPTAWGLFAGTALRSVIDGSEHLALVRGPKPSSDAEINVHTECVLGHVARSTACSCRAQLEAALSHAAGTGRGVIVLLRESQTAGSDQPLPVSSWPRAAVAAQVRRALCD